MQLDKRKIDREGREKPWTPRPKEKKQPKKPEIDKHTGLTLSETMQQENKWTTDRTLELDAIKKTPNFKPITVLVISSQLKHCTSEEIKPCLKEDEELIVITYDFFKDRFTDIIGR